MACVVILSFVGLMAACSSGPPYEEPKVIKWASLDSLMNHDTEKLRVINFWATWCAPCIKELPYFEALHAESHEQVDVTLVSLDFEDEFEKRVLPFVEKRDLKARVLVLDEIDYNSWIDKVDTTWTGAIPATLIINPSNGKRKFLEKEMTQEELTALVEEMKN